MSLESLEVEIVVRDGKKFVRIPEGIGFARLDHGLRKLGLPTLALPGEEAPECRPLSHAEKVKRLLDLAATLEKEDAG